MAEYLGKAAADSAGVTDGDVFDLGGLKGVDRTCVSRLATPVGEQVLPFIGTLGGPAALFTTDRPKVAPTFYACAFSFTKYLVGLVGVQEMLVLPDLMSRVQRNTDPVSSSPDGVLPRIERLTGKPMEALRTEWLQSIRQQH